MKIAIIGAGMIGGTLARLFANRGHDVFIGSRQPTKVAELVLGIGANVRCGTVDEAAQFADVVVIAVPLNALPDLAKQIGAIVRGKIVVDANNPYPERDGAAAKEAVAAGDGSGSWTQRHLTGAQVVKAFNTLYFKVLEQGGTPATKGVAIPLAGDDATARATVGTLIRDSRDV